MFIIAIGLLCLSRGLGRPDTPFGKDSNVKYVCPDLEVAEREGVISSPFYPNTYPNHLSCSWYILGKVGEVVSITFKDMDIEKTCCCNDKPCCLFNWLKIGPLENETERKYCGNSARSENYFVLTSNKLWVKFHVSDVKKGGRGFQFHYRIGPDPRLKCQNNEFKCANNQCVLSHSRCNGFPDCGDGSDEWDCSHRCFSGRSCRTLFQCYDSTKHCDGTSDCPDHSDEVGCGTCPPNMTLCGKNSTQCFNPVSQRCDRIYQCANGEDEKDCYGLCPGKIMCKSQRGCYTAKQRCNGITQCEDASDERDCEPDLCNSGVGGYLCDNGRCIQKVWTCDRTDDCGDGSDERNCLRNSVLTAALMGSLICALLLVIAISCTCRLHALRTLERRLPSRDTPTQLSRMSREFIFREPPPSYAVATQGEAHRTLCVENLHYGVPVHRGRRRPRRPRRCRPPPRPPGECPSPPLEAGGQSNPQNSKDEVLPRPPGRRGHICDKPSDHEDSSVELSTAMVGVEALCSSGDDKSEAVGLQTMAAMVPDESHVGIRDDPFCCDSDIDPLVV